MISLTDNDFTEEPVFNRKDIQDTINEVKVRYPLRVGSIVESEVPLGIAMAFSMWGVTPDDGDIFGVGVFDKDNGMIWGKTLDKGYPNGGAYNVIDVGDGLIVSGRNYPDDYMTIGRQYVTKLNKLTGRMIWETSFANSSGQNDNYFTEMVGYDDGSCICLSLIYDQALYAASGFPGYSIGIHKLRPDGTIQWDRIYEGTNLNHYKWGHVLTATSDGGFIFGGAVQDGTYKYNALLVKCNAAGEREWEKTYSPSDATSHDGFYDVKETEDGGYIAIGEISEPATHSILVKLTSTGEVSWSKQCSSSGGEDATVNVVYDGYIFLIGKGGNAIVVKTDLNGDVLWSKQIEDIEGNITDFYGQQYYYSDAETSIKLVEGKTELVFGGVSWDLADRDNVYDSRRYPIVYGRVDTNDPSFFPDTSEAVIFTDSSISATERNLGYYWFTASELELTPTIMADLVTEWHETNFDAADGYLNRLAFSILAEDSDTYVYVNDVINVTTGDSEERPEILHTLWSVGTQEYGEFGDGSTSSHTEFTEGIFQDAYQIACGVGFTFILKRDGTLWGCGHNGHGQLGLGTTQGYYSTFQQEPTGATDWVYVACGGNHTVATKQNGDAFSCGLNTSGQCGISTHLANYRSFTMIGNPISWMPHVACGQRHTLLTDYIYDGAWRSGQGYIWGCGANEYGQLGIGTISASEFDPVKATSSQRGIHRGMACGENYSIIIESGYMYGAGSNSSSSGLGMGSGGGNYLNWTNFSYDWMYWTVATFPGANVTMMIMPDGTLWGTGRNLYGQLGLGDETTRLQFVQVGIANDWKDVKVGRFITVAQKHDNTLWGAGSRAGGGLIVPGSGNVLVHTQLSEQEVHVYGCTERGIIASVVSS